MKRTYTYYVYYKLYAVDEPKGIQLAASSKADAYDKAVFEAIPKETGEHPYSAWVHSVTYDNGNYRTFNTHEGKPY